MTLVKYKTIGNRGFFDEHSI
ncbi:hypothetical protein EZS27_000931, partial [termite gut metagenome]